MIEQIYSSDIESAIRLYLGRWFIQGQVNQIIASSEIGQTCFGYLIIRISNEERRILRYVPGWVYGGTMETIAEIRSDSKITPSTSRLISIKQAAPTNDLMQELSRFDKSKLRHI
jgi:hypothetical protein